MKAHCPGCLSALKRCETVKGGLARRYDCPVCGARYRVSALQAGLLIFAPLVLLIVALRYLPSDIIPGHLGNILGVAAVGLGEVLVPKLARLERLSDAPTLMQGQIGFMRALGYDRTLRMQTHLVAIVSVLWAAMIATRWPDISPLFLLMIALGLVLPASTLLSLKCPSCRQRLVAPSFGAFRTLRSMAACHHCGFAPTPDTDILAASEQSKGGRLGLTLTYGAAIVAAGLLYQRSQLHAPKLPPASAPASFEVSLDWSYADLQGRSFPAADLRGKVIFLSHWASWCPACRAEMPSISKLQQAVGDDVTFAFVSEEEAETLQKFVRGSDLNLPIYRIEEAGAAVFSEEGLPTTYIIDPNGRGRFRITGAADWSDEQVVRYLRELVANG